MSDPQVTRGDARGSPGHTTRQDGGAPAPAPTSPAPTAWPAPPPGVTFDFETAIKEYLEKHKVATAASTNPLHTRDNPLISAERQKLWEAAKLDPLSDALRQKFESNLQAKIERPSDLTSLLNSLADHPTSEVPGALLEKLHELGHDDPQVVSEVLKLYAARPELPVPDGLIESSLALNSHSSTLAVFKLLAARPDVPASAAMLESHLVKSFELVKKRSESAEDLLKSFGAPIFISPIPGHSPETGPIGPIDFGDGDVGRTTQQRSPEAISPKGQALQVATSILAVLEQRTSVALPASLSLDITDAAANYEGAGLSMLERIQENAPKTKREFLQQAHKTIATRAPENYFAFARELYLKFPEAAMQVPTTVLGSAKLRAEAPIAELLAARSRIDPKSLDFRARTTADRALATIVVDRALADPKNTLDRQQLEPIALPLLNAVSDFAASDPILWEQLCRAGVETTNASVRMFAEQILQERAKFKEANITIFGKGIALLPICHSGAECDPQQVVGIGNRLGMDVQPTIRGDVDPIRCNVRKQEALLAVGTAAGKTEQPITIYFNSHGGPDHLWLGNGELGSHLSESFKQDEAINYEELASTMISSQMPSQKDNAVLDFRHVNIVFDSCISGDFSRQFLDSLAIQASQSGAQLAQYPTVVSAAQRGAVAFISTLDQKSYLQVAIDRATVGAEKITGSDLLEIDASLNRMTGSAPDSSSPRADRQDIAIFSPFRSGEVKLGAGILKQLIEQGHQIPPPTQPFAEYLEHLRQQRPFLPEEFQQMRDRPRERPHLRRAPDNNELSGLVLPPAFSRRT